MLYSYILDSSNLGIKLLHFPGYKSFTKGFADDININCILLDVDMPEINGLDALKLLKQSPKLKYVPVIIVSNYADPKIISSSYEYGAASYILKPNSNKAILEFLNAVKLLWGNTHY